MVFEAQTFAVPVPEHQRQMFAAAWAWLAEPGGAWSGFEKIAIARVARAAQPRPLWDRRPATIDHLSRARSHAASMAKEPDPETMVGAVPFSPLSALVVDTVERVAAEPGAIQRGWATEVVDAVGDAAYAELVAVIATVVPIDCACRLLGRDLEPLPDPTAGEPDGDRAETTVDIGAYVRVAADFPGANVARSLSLSPKANSMRLRLVRALYSGDRFGRLRWDEGALNRPQVELVAARTSALNECFY